METCKGARVAEEAGVAKNRCIFYGLCYIVMITEDLGTHLAAGRWGSKVLRLSNSVGM